jgi:hypothetical protein
VSSVTPRVSPQGLLSGAYLSWTDASGATQTLIFDLVEKEDWNGPSDITQSPVENGANITDHIRPGLRTVTLQIFLTNSPIESNQWTDMDFGAGDTVVLPARQLLVQPWDGKIQAPRWENNILAKALAMTAGGAIGSAVGGALGGAGGAIGGAIGAAAGSALGGALFKPHLEVDTIQTDGKTRQPTRPAPFTPIALTPATPGDYVQQTLALLESLRAAGQTVDVIGSKQACIGPTGIGGMGFANIASSRGSETGAGATLTLSLCEVRIVSTQLVVAPKPSVPRAKKPSSKGNQQGSELADELAAAAKAFAAGFRAGDQDTKTLLSGGGI